MKDEGVSCPDYIPHSSAITYYYHALFLQTRIIKKSGILSIVMEAPSASKKVVG